MAYHSLILSVILGVCGTTATIEYRSLDHICTRTHPATQASTVAGLIQRLVPQHAAEFDISVDPSIGPQNRDTFKLVTANNKLSITGSSGVAAAWGLYYYLSQYCGCHISWGGNQVNLPQTLPTVTSPGVTITSNDRFRYYQNVCTVSYSFAFWDWERWEREIDWMAMNGINLPLAFNAQESVWIKVYLSLGFTREEVDCHFGGPAFLAWSRMGNIKGWGGPLPDSWHSQQVALQHQILDRMRAFGMTPVLPAFAGHVPESITKHYPNANVSTSAPWGRFTKKYTETTLLDMEDPLFPVIGKAFLTEYAKEFGTDHIYNADTFNEMTPKSSSPAYLAAAGRAVYQGMVAGDPQAIWLMQGWLFINTAFWRTAQAKALLTSVPQGRMIVLDLYSDVVPFYDKFDSYYGQPFIWCMLHNFGGVLAMYGAVDTVNTGPIIGRSYPKSSMVGIGLTPEGINQNDVIYEFMLENSWRKKARDVAAWGANYAVRRYGQDNIHSQEAWKIFMTGIYNCTTGYSDHGNFDVAVVMRPRMYPPIVPDLWYNVSEVFRGWDNMIEASKTITNSDLFRYDLVDVTREALQLLAVPCYDNMVSAYKQRDISVFRSNGAALLTLMSDMDMVLATDPHFLLGRWIDSAKVLATTSQERDLYEYNARIQLTTWGPNAEILDYANKQWSGLMRSYYLERWKLFITEVDKAMTSGKKFNQSQFDIDVFNMVERPFTVSKDVYPTTPKGDQIKVCQMIHNKYRPSSTWLWSVFEKVPKRTKTTMDSLTKASNKWSKQQWHNSVYSN